MAIYERENSVIYALCVGDNLRSVARECTSRQGPLVPNADSLCICIKSVKMVCDSGVPIIRSVKHIQKMRTIRR